MDVVRLAQTTGARFLTESSKADARGRLGIYEQAVIYKIVADLRPTDFYKTMESETLPGTFQDVYHPQVRTPAFQGGVFLYCKVQIRDGSLWVISFKPR